MFTNLYAYYEGRLTNSDKRAIEKLAGRQLYFYETRYDETSNNYIPVTIEKSVFVNFCKTLVYTEPLIFDDSGFLIIDEGDWNWDLPELKRVESVTFADRLQDIIPFMLKNWRKLHYSRKGYLS